MAPHARATLTSLILTTTIVTHAHAQSGAPAAFVAITPGTSTNASTYKLDAFQIRNDSTGTLGIAKVSIFLQTAILPDIVYDPIGIAGDVVAKCLEPNRGAVETGYIVPADACEDPFTFSHDDGWDRLTVEFDDFDPGELFTFAVDADSTTLRGESGAGDAGSVSGLELSGANVTVSFDDGQVFAGRVFHQLGSNGGGITIVKPGTPPAPTLDALDLDEPATTTDAAQTIRIGGTPGAEVRLLHVEAALVLEDAEGFDVDPFEGNQAIVVQEKEAVVGEAGFVDVPVTLSRQSNISGLNYFLAAVVDADGSGRTGTTSNVVVLALGQSCRTAEDCSAATVCAGQVCDPLDGCVGRALLAGADCESDGKACTDDVCDGQGACTHPANTAACDDGVFCNGTDTCVDGGCSVHAGDPCAGADGDADCSESCDADTGACTAPDAADSLCENDSNACTDDVCDGAGTCIHRNNGASCDDGRFCTAIDTCDEGTCRGGATRDCNDGIACTIDHCDDDASACLHITASAGCDDGVACNGAETCALDGCHAGSAPDCGGFDGPCTAGVCDEASGGCIDVAANEEQPCDDADRCTTADACHDGTCTGISYCGVPSSRAAEPTITDALYLLRGAIRAVECDPCECDVDHNGAVTVIDALRVLQVIVGLPLELDCRDLAATATTTTSQSTSSSTSLVPNSTTPAF